MRRHKTERRVSCGNAGAVESVESQKQASPSFHEPLGNLAKRRRDSHISTAPTTRADGKSGKPKAGFPLFPPPRIYIDPKNKNRAAAGTSPRASRPARRRAPPAPIALVGHRP